MSEEIKEENPKKIGRPRKYEFAGLSKEEYDKKWYEKNKEKILEKCNENYEKNKEKIKSKSKILQSKYREGYHLLIMLYNNNEINTSKENLVKIKNILE